MTRLVQSILAALLLLATPALAQTSPSAVLAELGSDRYEVRQQATHRLLTDESLTPAVLAAMYAQATQPEQRCRLLRVAMHQTIRRMVAEVASHGDRSSLGVSMTVGLRPRQIPEVNHPAVAVTQVYPGFPAFEVLQSGDLIVSVDGQALADGDPATIRDDFVALVQHHDLAQPLKLGVYRQGQMFEVTVKPASFEALQTIYDANHPGLPTLRSPYLERWLAVRQQLRASVHALPPLVVEGGGAS